MSKSREQLRIAMGEGTKMFTLRAFYKYMDGWGNMHESSYHIQNLSIDPTKAQKKARAYANKTNMPLVDTSWVFDANIFDIERKSKEELALLKAEKEKRIAKAKEISAKIQINRITVTGKLVHEKGYQTQWGYVQKGIFLLDTGQKVYGSIPSLQDGWITMGDYVQFDAKIEKPKDFDGIFYFFKRPTKPKLLNKSIKI